MNGRKEAWTKLRVGDRVRFVRIPTFQGVIGGGLHAETLQLYKQLIARGLPARVFQIDEYGLPWIRCQFRLRNGKWHYHWLAINDDSWVLVKPRHRKRERSSTKRFRSPTNKRSPRRRRRNV